MRVVIADDSVLLREGLARLLVEAGFDVAGQAADADELLARSRRSAGRGDRRHPHAADPHRRGPPRCEGDPHAHPELAVLVLSQYVRPSYALELLAESAEGVGYLLKDRVSDLDELADAIRRVGKGGSVLDPSACRQLVGRRRRDGPDLSTT